MEHNVNSKLSNWMTTSTFWPKDKKHVLYTTDLNPVLLLSYVHQQNLFPLFFIYIHIISYTLAVTCRLTVDCWPGDFIELSLFQTLSLQHILWQGNCSLHVRSYAHILTCCEECFQMFTKEALWWPKGLGRIPCNCNFPDLNLSRDLWCLLGVHTNPNNYNNVTFSLWLPPLSHPPSASPSLSPLSVFPSGSETD